MNILGSIIRSTVSKKQCTAENAIYAASRNKIRSLEVEQLYMTVRYKFKVNMRRGALRKGTIKQIRMYLEDNVKIYYHQKFKNDAHAIYSLMQARDITVDNLKYLDNLIPPA